MKKKNIAILSASVFAATAIFSCSVAIAIHAHSTPDELSSQVSNSDFEKGEVEVNIADLVFEVANAEENEPAFDALQSDIESVISATKATVGGEWSVYVNVLKNDDTLSINQQPMQAASVIKLFVMGAVYDKYEELTSYYQYDDIDGLIESMITISDNEATDLLVAMLGRGDCVSGRKAVNDFCKNYGFTNTTMDRMMADDNIYSDNYTTAEDCSNFLKMVYNGEFEHSKDMLNYLKNQTRKNKIPEGVPSNVLVANKTGELDDVQNDAAIVFSKTPYILCVISDGVTDYQIPIDAVVDISEYTYDYISDNY